MRRRVRTAVTVLPLVAVLATGCDDTPTDIEEPPIQDPADTVELAWDFREDAEGWEPGFADYPEEWGERMELQAGHEPLPEELETSGSGLRIGATNHSDDVFMFWKTRAEGLAPDTEYTVRFEVEFATNSPAGCAGIGGAPGESVWVKAGATLDEPDPQPEEGGGREDYMVLNVDKGNQSQAGSDAVILGDVGTAESGCTDRSWDLKTLDGEETLEVTSGPDGDVWLFVGTDSGFEGRTELYYVRYEAVFEPR